MNTKITYTYTDASNYKREKVVVVRGAFHRHLVEEMLREDVAFGGGFLPGQVGLPWPQLQWENDGFAFPTDDDHVWCVLGSCEETERSPTVKVTAEQLLHAFQNAHSRGWDEMKAAQELELYP